MYVLTLLNNEINELQAQADEITKEIRTNIETLKKLERQGKIEEMFDAQKQMTAEIYLSAKRHRLINKIDVLKEFKQKITGMTD